jgi:hypothetical protein
VGSKAVVKPRHPVAAKTKKDLNDRRRLKNFCIVLSPYFAAERKFWAPGAGCSLALEMDDVLTGVPGVALWAVCRRLRASACCARVRCFAAESGRWIAPAWRLAEVARARTAVSK